jgi:hypothetical protein
MRQSSTTLVDDTGFRRARTDRADTATAALGDAIDLLAHLRSSKEGILAAVPSACCRNVRPGREK